MVEFLLANALTIIFGVLALVTSVIAIFYARRMYELERASPERNHGRSVTVYWSRQDMIESLLRQYDLAVSGDDIWAHAVGLQNFPGQVSEKILSAAGRGVSFRYLILANHPAQAEFLAIFKPIRNASIRASGDNALRVQGLSTKEVVVAFPTLTTYTAIRFTDPNFVAVIRNWFDTRWVAASTILKGDNSAEQ